MTPQGLNRGEVDPKMMLCIFQEAILDLCLPSTVRFLSDWISQSLSYLKTLTQDTLSPLNKKRTENAFQYMKPRVDKNKNHVEYFSGFYCTVYFDFGGIIDIRRLPRLFDFPSSIRAILSISRISSSRSFFVALKALALRVDISKGATFAASELSLTSSSSSALPSKAAQDGSFFTDGFLSPVLKVEKLGRHH